MAVDDFMNSYWMNAACLGPNLSVEQRHSVEDAPALISEAFRSCIHWVADYYSVSPDTVLLTSGATQACDVALVARSRRPALLLYTDLGHDCTVRSVNTAADFLGLLHGTHISTGSIPVADLFSLPPKEFGRSIAERLASVSAGSETVFVIEHVTSADGLRLPLAEIDRAIRLTAPNIELVIDGAQAVGLWRPPAGFNWPYAGCFHKYADAPAATGFCLLSPEVTKRLPHHLRAGTICALNGRGEYFPTIDVQKWVDCAIALESSNSLAAAEARVSEIEELRALLFGELEMTFPSTYPEARCEYRSHIIGLDLGSEAFARRTWQDLADHGFHTKLTGQSIRVSLHHNLSADAIRALAHRLRAAAQSEPARY